MLVLPSQLDGAITSESPFEKRLIVFRWGESGSEEDFRPCGSVVEHTLGKGEVAGSILAMGSKFCMRN